MVLSKESFEPSETVEGHVPVSIPDKFCVTKSRVVISRFDYICWKPTNHVTYSGSAHSVSRITEFKDSVSQLSILQHSVEIAASDAPVGISYRDRSAELAFRLVLPDSMLPSMPMVDLSYISAQSIYKLDCKFSVQTCSGAAYDVSATREITIVQTVDPSPGKRTIFNFERNGETCCYGSNKGARAVVQMTSEASSAVAGRSCSINMVVEPWQPSSLSSVVLFLELNVVSTDFHARIPISMGWRTILAENGRVPEVSSFAFPIYGSAPPSGKWSFFELVYNWKVVLNFGSCTSLVMRSPEQLSSHTSIVRTKATLNTGQKDDRSSGFAEPPPSYTDN